MKQIRIAFPFRPSARCYIALAAALLGGVVLFETGCGARPGPVSSSEQQQPAVQTRPNIVWICLDACRAKNLSCYGYDRPTSPAIDGLAQRGVLFENAFSQAFNTPMSVSSCLTGRHFPVCYAETRDWRESLREPPPDELLLPTILSAAGYYSVMIGTQEFFPSRSRLGRAFDRAYFLPHKATMKTTKPGTSAGSAGTSGEYEIQEPYAPFSRIVETVPRALHKADGKPFFLYVHAMETHFPHVLEPEYQRWIDPNYISTTIENGHPKTYSGNSFAAQDIALLRGLYDGGILKADEYVGKLLDVLQSEALLDNTIVIISSDHGELLGENGDLVGHAKYTEYNDYVLGGAFPERTPLQNPCYTYDEVCHVPLVMVGPGLPKGLRVSAIAQNADIVPTLLDLLGIATHARFDGVSLRPTFANPGQELHDAVFVKDTSYGLDAIPRFLLRDRQYKYSLDRTTNEEQMWALPDGILTRTDALTQGRARADALRKRIEQAIAPLWQAYEALPRTKPVTPFFERVENATLEQIPDTDPSPQRTILLFQVPDGEYEVDLEATAAPLPNKEGAVRVMATLQGGTSSTVDIPTGEGPTTLPVGACAVDAGTCRLSIVRLDTQNEVAIRGLWFRPVGQPDESVAPVDLQEKQDTLKTLGYVN